MTTNNNQLNIINKHDKDIDLKIWIKTLLYSYKVFPNLINTVDKIINLQASSMSFTSSIYNNSNSTKSQIERIIDLSERKKSLINIHLMIDKIFKDLSYNNRELAEKKFIDKLTNEEIAQEYDISTRTVYRKLNKIIDEIYTYFLKMNWNLKFI
ncbi:MAG: sigma-70 family RNA polymerase sigma factor, partial [Clostridia bacterium]|nr:sigma-70 family RNA polymerase sigma factor [Clostridia bacterium]